MDLRIVLQRSVNPHSWILLLLSAVLLSGCLSSAQPNPPKNWTRAAVEAGQSLQSGGAKLQVIVTYDASYSTHTALRLADRSQRALFWDPAGRYGETSDGTLASHIKRVNDLIVENEPTLEMYWQSSVNASDTAMEVFEWDLSDPQALRLRKTLLRGSGLEEGRKEFQTKTIKPFCSFAISEFLQISDEDPVSLERTYWLPHGLAEALYRSDPSRVIIFRRGRKATIYTHPSLT